MIYMQTFFDSFFVIVSTAGVFATLNQTYMRDLKFELGNYFEPLMLSVLHYMEMILDDRYLLRRYINCPDDKLSKGGVEIRKNYRRLVSLRDEFESVRKSRQKPVTEG